MSPIQELLKEKKAFIGYMTAGFSGVKDSIKYALALEKGGVDILELGIPFSDPIGDGPLLQESHEKALKNGITPDDVVTIAEGVREKSDIPIVLMSYYNPVLQGGEKFIKKAKKAGVDAFLIVDFPLEESDMLYNNLKKHGLDTIFLVTPDTSDKRLKKIAERTSSFIYLVSRRGTTGAKNTLPKNLLSTITDCKRKSKRPVAVGFGISQKKDAATILQKADGFIVGSKIMDYLHKKPPVKDVIAFIKRLDPRG